MNAESSKTAVGKMQEFGMTRVEKILTVAIALLLITGSVNAWQVCEYGSDYDCEWHKPSTWPGCWIGVLIDVGNCVTMLFIELMTEIILINPNINEFKPFVNDIVSILFPIYVITIIITGIYIIFLSTSPTSRARAKSMLLRLIMGMAMVTVSLSIYEILLNLSGAVAGKIMSGWLLTGGGSSGLAIIGTIIAVSIVFFYISVWAFPLAVIIALISVASRLFLVSLMAILFPLTIFFYFFEFTRDIGSKMMRYTLMAIFTQPVQALMLVIMIIGLNNASTSSDWLEKLVCMVIGLAGLFLVILAPLLMMKLMEWVGGAVAGAGMILAYKRPMAGAFLVSMGGIASGMGPEALVAGGSAYVLGHSFQKRFPSRRRLDRTRRLMRKGWGKVAGTVRKTTPSLGAWLGRRHIIGRPLKTAYMAGKKYVGQPIGKAYGVYKNVKKRVGHTARVVRKYGGTIGKSIFLPGYGIYATGKFIARRTGISLRSSSRAHKLSKHIKSIGRAGSMSEIWRELRKSGADMRGVRQRWRDRMKRHEKFRDKFEKAKKGRADAKRYIKDHRKMVRKIDRKIKNLEKTSSIMEKEGGYGWRGRYNKVRGEIKELKDRRKELVGDKSKLKEFDDRIKGLEKERSKLGKLKGKGWKSRVEKFMKKDDKINREIEKLREDRKKFTGDKRKLKTIDNKIKGLEEERSKLGKTRVGKLMRKEGKINREIEKLREDRKKYAGSMGRLEGRDKGYKDEIKKLKGERSWKTRKKELKSEIKELKEERSMEKKDLKKKWKKTDKKIKEKIKGLEKDRSELKKDLKDWKDKGKHTRSKIKNLKEKRSELKKTKPKNWKNERAKLKKDIEGLKENRSMEKEEIMKKLEEKDRDIRKWEDKRDKFRFGEDREGEWKSKKWFYDEEIGKRKDELFRIKESESAEGMDIEYLKRKYPVSEKDARDLQRELYTELKGKFSSQRGAEYMDPVTAKNTARDRAKELVNKYKGENDFKVVEDGLREAGIDKKKISNLRDKYDKRGLDMLKKDAEDSIKFKKAVEHDLDSATTFEEAEKINKGLGRKGLSEEEFERLKKREVERREKDVERIEKEEAPDWARRKVERDGISPEEREWAIEGMKKEYEDRIKKFDNKIRKLKRDGGSEAEIKKLENQRKKLADRSPEKLSRRELNEEVKARVIEGKAQHECHRRINETEFIVSDRFTEELKNAVKEKDLTGRLEYARNHDEVKAIAKEFGVSGRQIDKMGARDMIPEEELIKREPGKIKKVGEKARKTAKFIKGEKINREIDKANSPEEVEAAAKRMGISREDIDKMFAEERDIPLHSAKIRHKNLNTFKESAKKTVRKKAMEKPVSIKEAREMHKRDLAKFRESAKKAIEERKHQLENKIRPLDVIKKYGIHIGMFLFMPGYIPYMAYNIGSSLYGTMTTAKAYIGLQNITAIKHDDDKKYKKLKKAMRRGGASRGEARTLINDEPVISKDDFDKLKKRASDFIVAKKFTETHYPGFTKEFLKPFKPRYTLKTAMIKGKKYGASKTTLKRIKKSYKREMAEIEKKYARPKGAKLDKFSKKNLRKEKRQAFNRVNKQINNEIIESRGYHEHLKKVGRKHGLLDIETEDIYDHFKSRRIREINKLEREEEGKLLKTKPEEMIEKMNKINTESLAGTHRSAVEIATIEGFNKMTPEEYADYARLGLVSEGELERESVKYGVDLANNLHTRMLLEDYMGIGPRPSEFYHGIGPETKEEREKERERGEESPLYAAATWETETLPEIIAKGLDGVRKPKEEEKEE